jgi:hypothetical protein
MQFEVARSKNNRLSGRPRLKKLYTIKADLREWRRTGEFEAGNALRGGYERASDVAQ